MLTRLLPLLCLSALLSLANDRVRIRTTDGTIIEGTTSARTIAKIPLAQIVSVHSGAPASDSEATKIKAGIAAVQGADRAARDIAVDELTAIGLPLMTPLLQAYKDTDQHEPRPLYRLFERIMPGYADHFDRSLTLIRLAGGGAQRVALPEAGIEVTDASGSKTSVPWSKIRTLAVRQRSVKRTLQVHSLKHSTQIEFLDTGIVLDSASKATLAAQGLVRLSWDTDSWASDANGLTKPGSPAYKSHLVDGHPFGALVARVEAAGATFFIGKAGSVAGKPGRLRLAVNDNAHWQNNLGTFLVTLTASDAYDLGEAQ